MLGHCAKPGAQLRNWTFKLSSALQLVGTDLVALLAAVVVAVASDMS